MRELYLDDVPSNDEFTPRSICAGDQLLVCATRKPQNGELGLDRTMLTSIADYMSMNCRSGCPDEKILEDLKVLRGEDQGSDFVALLYLSYGIAHKTLHVANLLDSPIAGLRYGSKETGILRTYNFEHSPRVLQSHWRCRSIYEFPLDVSGGIVFFESRLRTGVNMNKGDRNRIDGAVMEFSLLASINWINYEG